MLVSHTADHVTHAIIGGSETIELSMTDDAQFMIMMSSTLYSDQKLAVVREVLCNAWDAHIDAGIQDTPVKVTVDAENLIIQDFGKGIPHPLIGQIYGTYGKSTKKNDGKQTGGFGLGSKAPYAYTSNFEVVSACEGKRTIYRMSKSSGSVAGKPGITPIAQFDTTEQGVTVTIPLENGADRSAFRHLVKRIARNGEMKVQLNGHPDLLSVLPFSQMKHNFMLTEIDVLGESVDPSLMLRYGNVIYPIPQEDKYEDAYNDVIKILEKLNQQRYNSGGYYYSSRTHNVADYSIVFMAEPNTISVTPSRESLSMQEFTINAVKKLLEDFVDLVGANLEKELFSILENQIHTVALKEDKTPLYTSSKQMPVAYNHKKLPFIGSLPELATQVSVTNYPDDLPGFHKKDIGLRVRKIIDAKGQNRGLAQTYEKAIKQGGATGNNWFIRRVFGPLVHKIMENKEMALSRLIVIDKPELFGLQRANGGGVRPINQSEIINSPLIEECAPYLRQIIVVSYQRADAADFRVALKDYKDTIGNHAGYFAYTVPRSLKKRDAALEFFKKLNMIVVDLTPLQEFTVVEKEAKIAEKAERVKREKGLVLLSSAIVRDHVSLSRLREPDAKRSEKFDFTVRLNALQGGYGSQLNRWTSSCSNAIVRLYGHRGVGLVNDKQMEKYETMGIPDLDKWIIDRVALDVRNSKALHRYFQCKGNAFERALISKSNITSEDLGNFRSSSKKNEQIHRLLNQMIACPRMARYADLNAELSQEDKDLLTVWQNIQEQYEYKGYWSRNNPKPQIIKDVELYISCIPIKEEMYMLIDAVSRNIDELQFIDTNYLFGTWGSSSNSHKATYGIELLTQILLK